MDSWLQIPFWELDFGGGLPMFFIPSATCRRRACSSCCHPSSGTAASTPTTARWTPSRAAAIPWTTKLVLCCCLTVCPVPSSFPNEQSVKLPVIQQLVFGARELDKLGGNYDVQGSVLPFGTNPSTQLLLMT